MPITLLEILYFKGQAKKKKLNQKKKSWTQEGVWVKVVGQGENEERVLF